MRFVIWCHSLASDWNHGNAHFLRGVATELLARGHDVRVLESRDAWSARNLVAEAGSTALSAYRGTYPNLDSSRYDPGTLDIDEALDGADVVLVHEWNEHALVRDIGAHRAAVGGYLLFFHDTHHRAVTDRRAMAAYDLRNYDGVLAFGAVLREVYLREGWTQRAWVWHEAADTRVFRPLDHDEVRRRDLVWIGNWGDEERTAELKEFLIEPVRSLGLTATVHGVRYPDAARAALADAGISYEGWLPNHEAPRGYARHRMTVHVPRRPYAHALPGIPTIRVFEALACGIPLVSAPWDDAERLFHPGRDYLVATSGEEMCRHLRALREDRELREELSSHGLHTIRERHTCAHRVDELLGIVHALHPLREVSAA
jgi:spore maturation protein CgeB